MDRGNDAKRLAKQNANYQSQLELKEKSKLYSQLVEERSPKSKTGAMTIKAFIVGGLICCVGQLIRDLGESLLMLKDDDLACFSCIVLVFIGATLTGIGVYDRIGKFAGAGSVVPITGFANSVVAPAMEFRAEGFIMGLGAKLFSLAGPVLVYGVISSILVGLVHLLLY